MAKKILDKLSNEEVLQIGFVSKYMRDLLFEYNLYVIKLIGKSNKESNLLNKIMNDIDKLKSNLEDLLFYRLDEVEKLNIINKATDVFYGKRNEKLVKEVFNMMKNFDECKK